MRWMCRPFSPLCRSVTWLRMAIIKDDLADVVQGGRRGDEAPLAGRQNVPVGLEHQLLQQHGRQGLDALDVQAVLAVVPLRDLAQNGDHQAAVLLPLIELLGHHPTQAALPGVELGKIGYPAVDDAGVEGAADEIGRAQLIGPVDDGTGVLTGNHDDRDIVQQVLPGHPGQNLKAIHIRHHDIQQHQRDPGAELFEQAHALGTVRGFQQLEIFAQDPGQDLAVHGGVVHDEDSGAGLALHVEHVLGLVLRHHHVFLALGLVHPFVGQLDGLLDGDAGRENTTDAGGDAEALKARHPGTAQFLVDEPQLADKIIGRDHRQDQEQLIAAVADEHVRGADVVLDDGGDGAQGRVACFMAERVIAELEIVQVDHGDACRQELVAQLILIKAAVIHAGQRVGVQALVLVGEGVAVRLQRLDHLHNIRIAVHFHIAGRGLVDLGADMLQLGFLSFAEQRLPPDAPGAGVSIPPGGVTGVLFNGLPVQQADDGVDLAEAGHLFFGLPHCHLGNGIFRHSFGAGAKTLPGIPFSWRAQKPHSPHTDFSQYEI